MNPFKITAEEVLKKLEVNKKTGLTLNQVQKHKERYGANSFSPPKRDGFMKKLIENLKDPMLMMLILATVISIASNIYLHIIGEHAEFIESLGILLAVALSTTIAMKMEGRSEKAFDKLNNMNENIKVKVIRNGEVIPVLKQEIVVGDLVIIETGDKLPADGRLIEVDHLKTNESMLTGESDTVRKDATVVFTEDRLPIAERKNMVYGGTFVTEGKGLYVVTEVGDNTEMGKIAEGLKDTEAGETPLQEKLGELGKKISTIGMIAAGVIFIIRIYKMYTGDGITMMGVMNSFIVSITLIVAAVPEGLPTMIAMTLSLNMEKMAKNNSLVKKLIACETVGSVNVICSDKTGTLTENKMTVMDVYHNGALGKPENLYSGHMVQNFCLNSTANIKMENGKAEFIGNPTECSLLEAFTKTICSLSPTNCRNYNNENTVCGFQCKKYIDDEKIIKNYQRIRDKGNITYQYPFTSDRKMMSTIVEDGQEFMILSKGAPEKILEKCTHAVWKDKVIPLTKEIKGNINESIMKLQMDAKRVLAFAHKNTSLMDWEKRQEKVENSLVFDGFVGIEDPLRSDVYEAVQNANSAGIDLKILTGDNKITATAIAKQLGIVKENTLILEAHEIDEMSDEELEKKIDQIVVIARSKPLTKMRVVEILKKKGNVVAVTGDGINDAPALKKADVGIAMGIAGTEVSKEASDIVLLDDSFTSIVKANFWGRAIYENFQRFIQFQLTVNVVAFVTAFLAEVFGFEMPFTALQLLWVNIVMDGPPALSLGLEPPRKDLMKRKPIRRDANIVTKDMLQRIVLNGMFMVGMLMYLMVARPLGGSSSAQGSIVFTTFVLFQIFNAFNAREFKCESIFKHIHNNKFMLGMIGITFMIQVLVTQFGGNVFKTVPLDFNIWMKMIGYASTVIIFSEIVKIIKKIVNKE